MSIIQKIRHGLFGQQLLQNAAGFRAVRGSGRTGPWISEGESLQLIPEGIQEAQFPVAVIGSDTIPATVQVSVVFVYGPDAEKTFNFAYDVATLSHTGGHVDATKKLIVSILAPQIIATMRQLNIDAMVNESVFQKVDCDGIEIKSIFLRVTPTSAEVMAALGADKAQELVRRAATARHQTQLKGVQDNAALRVVEHQEALNATEEEKALIAEQAKNQLAKAQASAAAQKELAEQEAKAAEAMVDAFEGNAVAFALYKIATSGGDITLTSEFMTALNSGKK